jgi:tRNA threonylcarbamoyladenosine biosynthesis protein TsaE
MRYKKNQFDIQDIYTLKNKSFISMTTNETRNFGKHFAKVLNKGDVVLFYGDLGSGKTTFIQGILNAFGYEGFANSASFIIINEYDMLKNNIRVVHIDLYRLQSTQICYLELEEYLYGNNIALIEWPDKSIANYGNWIIRIHHNFSDIQGLNSRTLHIEKI